MNDENAQQRLSTQTWVSAAFLLISFSVLSKLLGFLREVLVARNFGIGAEVDAFNVAFTVPTILGGVIGVSFGTALIPLYHRAESAGNPDRAKNLVRTITGFTFICTVLVILAVQFVPGAIISAIAPSLPGPTSAIAAEMVKWLSLMALGLAFYNVLSSVYNALHHFKVPAVTDMLNNLWPIVFLLFFSRIMGIYALVLGVIAGFFFVIFALTSHLYRQGQDLVGLGMNFRSREFREFLLFAAPVTVFIFLSQMHYAIENYFASSLDTGSIASMGYAKRLFELLPSLLAVNLAKATFPMFSTLWTEQNIRKMRKTAVKLTRQVIIYLLPLTVVLIAFSGDIVRLVFMRGKFDAVALDLTSGAFMFYASGIVAHTLTYIYLSLSFAFTGRRAPIAGILLTNITMITLNCLMTPVYGINGIALANSLSALPAVSVLLLSIRERLEGFDLKSLSVSFVKAAVCSALALLPVLWFRPAPPYGFLLPASLYFALYFILGCFVMKEDMTKPFRSLKKHLGGNRDLNLRP